MSIRSVSSGPTELLAIVQETLRGLSPIDDRERDSRDRTLAELARLDRPFDRTSDRVHLTASAVVIGPQGTLLHLHKRLSLWLQPGGHIDPGETPWDAALREVAEETGLNASLVDTPPRLLHVDVHEAGEHTHLDLRYLVAAAGPPAPPEGESQQVAWFSWSDALALADPGLRGALRAALQHPRTLPSQTNIATKKSP
jgi:8-oxo-dGTP pyrophosphatase MutT (NUDIX family)